MINTLAASILLILSAYLLGAIPTGYLAGKYLKGIDIREHGSGSTGATNVLRTLGKPAGIMVLAIDVFKGVLAVGIVRVVYLLMPTDVLPLDWQPWLIVLAAIGAILGHSKSIFLDFTGGKSVATSLGVLLVMNPLVAVGTLATFLIMLALFRIVSLGSIVGAMTANILMIILGKPLPYILFAAIGGIYVIVRHRSNISRLLAGTEPKLGQKLPEMSAD